MKSFTALLGIVSATLAQSLYPLTYNIIYDEGWRSMSIVECADLEGQGYKNFSDLPDKVIGGAFAIAGYDSANCSTCWNLTYPENGKNVYFLAIDYADAGFNTGYEAMDNLTNGLAYQLGTINVTAQEVPRPNCGLPA